MIFLYFARRGGGRPVRRQNGRFPLKVIMIENLLNMIRFNFRVKRKATCTSTSTIPLTTKRARVCGADSHSRAANSPTRERLDFII